MKSALLAWVLGAQFIGVTEPLPDTLETPHAKLAIRMLTEKGQELALNHGMNVQTLQVIIEDKVELLGIIFETFQKASEDKGRAIAMRCAYDYLELFNENEQIRPYLKRHPLKMEDLLITVGYTPTRFDKQEMLTVVLAQGRVNFIYNAMDGRQLSDRQESFEEALAKVRAMEGDVDWIRDAA